MRPFKYPGPRPCLTAAAGSYTTTRCRHARSQRASHWHPRPLQPKEGKKRGGGKYPGPPVPSLTPGDSNQVRVDLDISIFLHFIKRQLFVLFGEIANCRVRPGLVEDNPETFYARNQRNNQKMIETCQKDNKSVAATGQIWDNVNMKIKDIYIKPLTKRKIHDSKWK